MQLPSSFRDPSGHVFVKDGELFRQVKLQYRENYDLLLKSGLYEKLVNSKLLIPHEEVDGDPASSSHTFKVIRPERIPFISYPYEWSFSQLKDAALATLAVQKVALDFGMTLKDASAYNVQFSQGRPVLIDTLSFSKYQEGEPWLAYKQFCQHFLAPLAVMSHKHVGAGQFSRIYIDGMPVELASALLPLRTQFIPSLQIHIHLHARLHARLQRRSERQSHPASRPTRAFSLRSFLGLIDSLESAVKGLKWKPGASAWIDYYEDDSYSASALESKIKIVSGFLDKVRPSTVWDLGTNTGKFSRLASDRGISTLALDGDPAAVEKNYLTSVERKETSLLPLVLDIANPSPKIGWANEERLNLEDRGPADMVLALALIHHLRIGENVPLKMIARFLRSLCSWAVVEFVPASDKKVIGLLSTRKENYSDYSMENFETAFGEYFDIQSKQLIDQSERSLYLMKGM